MPALAIHLPSTAALVAAEREGGGFTMRPGELWSARLARGFAAAGSDFGLLPGDLGRELRRRVNRILGRGTTWHAERGWSDAAVTPEAVLRYREGEGRCSPERDPPAPAHYQSKPVGAHAARLAPRRAIAYLQRLSQALGSASRISSRAWAELCGGFDETVGHRVVDQLPALVAGRASWRRRMLAAAA